jgi:hypothetical protein
MTDRKQRVASKKTKSRRPRAQRTPLVEADRARLEADLQQASMVFAREVLPGIDAFRRFMARESRKVEVAPFLDHIEGPQIIVNISRKDGQITATLIAEVTPDGIAPYWDVQSTGRVRTHWTEKIPAGLGGLTQQHVLEKLTELYATDFS